MKKTMRFLLLSWLALAFYFQYRFAPRTLHVYKATAPTYVDALYRTGQIYPLQCQMIQDVARGTKVESAVVWLPPGTFYLSAPICSQNGGVAIYGSMAPKSLIGAPTIFLYRP